MDSIIKFITENKIIAAAIGFVALLLFFPRMFRQRRRARRRARVVAYRTATRVARRSTRRTVRRATRTARRSSGRKAKKPWQIKGSRAAKLRMARIRRLRAA